MAEPGATAGDHTRGRRRDSRLRVRLAAQMITLDGTARIVMADISRSGARLTGLLPRLRIGQQAVIQWHGFEAFGFLAWCNLDQCGLEFDEPLSQAILLRTRNIQDDSPLMSDRDLARNAASAFVAGRVRL